MRTELDEIRAHIGLPNRSTSFTEMVNKNSNERQQERGI